MTKPIRHLLNRNKHKADIGKVEHKKFNIELTDANRIRLVGKPKFLEEEVE